MIITILSLLKQKQLTHDLEHDKTKLNVLYLASSCSVVNSHPNFEVFIEIVDDNCKVLNTLFVQQKELFLFCSHNFVFVSHCLRLCK